MSVMALSNRGDTGSWVRKLKIPAMPHMSISRRQIAVTRRQRHTGSDQQQRRPAQLHFFNGVARLFGAETMFRAFGRFDRIRKLSLCPRRQGQASATAASLLLTRILLFLFTDTAHRFTLVTVPRVSAYTIGSRTRTPRNLPFRLIGQSCPISFT